MRQRIFRIIQIGNKEDVVSRLFDIFIAVVIILNILVLFLQTFAELSPIFTLLDWIERVTIGIFCVEYLLRIWTADLLYPKEKRGMAILRFLISYDGIIDLLTILPFFFLSGFVAFRMLRVVRILHLFRINAKYDSFHVITNVLRDKKNQIASSVFIILILMLAASLGMYSAEHSAQPEVFCNAFSGMWWAVSAMLTVGYGDIYPITTAGKLMAIITAFLGVGVVAIPTGIISAGFVEQYSKMKSLSEYANNTDLNFITIRLTKGHEWIGRKVSETALPQGIRLALVVQGDEVIVPRGDTVLVENENLILAAEGYDNEHDLKLSEKYIEADSDWRDVAIKDLDISRQTTIVSIRRRNRLVIPKGSTVLKQGDKVLLYSKHHL